MNFYAATIKFFRLCISRQPAKGFSVDADECKLAIAKYVIKRMNRDFYHLLHFTT